MSNGRAYGETIKVGETNILVLLSIDVSPTPLYVHLYRLISYQTSIMHILFLRATNRSDSARVLVLHQPPVHPASARPPS